MPANTTSEKAKLTGETERRYQEMQRWQEYAEARAQRVTRAVAALRKGYDFKIRKHNEPEHPRKKKRTEEHTILETPALTRAPESLWRPQPEPTASGCTCCGGNQEVLCLTRAAVNTLNALNAQAQSVEPYDPYSRVRKWLNASSVWWYKEANTDNTDQGNNVAPFTWVTWDGRRAP